MCCPELVRSIHEDSDVAPGGGADPRDPGAGPLGAAAAAALGRLRRVQDLTHTLTERFPVFPTYRPFALRRLASIETDGYAAAEMCLAEHIGTHLDAPAHFCAGGDTADRLPVAQLVAPLAVVSIVDRVARDHDAMLTVDDLLGWEARHGRIPAGAVVALRSGWEARLADPPSFLNADGEGVLHSPGFAPEAARFLVAERDIAGVASETMSLDIGATTEYEVHRVLLGAGKFGLENVANLGRVPPAGAVLVVGAPKHAGATGGPARLLALC